jgi:hypothetical protein
MISNSAKNKYNQVYVIIQMTQLKTLISKFLQYPDDK